MRRPFSISQRRETRGLVGECPVTTNPDSPREAILLVSAAGTLSRAATVALRNR